MWARLRLAWRRTLIHVQVVGGALLLALAAGAVRAADGEAVPLVLAGAAAAVGVGLLLTARRDRRRLGR